MHNVTSESSLGLECSDHPSIALLVTGSSQIVALNQFSCADVDCFMRTGRRTKVR